MSTKAKAQVVCGANELSIDLPENGMTISQMIERFGTTLNVPPNDPDSPRQFLVNGEQAREGRTINPGDSVEVLREAGDKG